MESMLLEIISRDEAGRIDRYSTPSDLPPGNWRGLNENPWVINHLKDHEEASY